MDVLSAQFIASFQVSAEVHIGIWRRLTQLVAALIFAALAAGVVAWYLPVFRTNQALRRQILLLQSKLEKETDRAKQLEMEIRSLQSDPTSIERLAREKLGFVKPGETMIRFEESPASSIPAR